MHIISVNNVGFKGQTKYLSCDSEGKYKKIAECLYGSSSFGDTRGLKEFIQKRTYPYASVEETIGNLHNNRTYQIYIADPKEVVDKAIKVSHDYVIYDNEPSFPDVKEKYFTPQYGDLDKEFQYVLEYFKRVENTAVQSQDEKSAKFKQELAQTCKRILNESSDLRVEEEELKSKIQQKKDKIELIKLNTEKFQRELDIKNGTLPRHRKTLRAKERKLDILFDKKNALKNKKDTKTEDIDLINQKIQKMTEIKEDLQNKINHYEAKVFYWESYIKNASKKIVEYSNAIKKMQNRLGEIERELQPNFEKLCAFYTSNGIKIIKKF